MNINDYEPAPAVQSLDYSDTYAIVHRSHLKNPDKMRVEIPKGLENVQLCRVMIWYLQSPDFLRLASETRSDYASDVATFLRFLAQTLPDTNLRVPNSVLKFFKGWLIKNKSNAPTSQNDILRRSIAVLKAFIDAEDRPAALMDDQYYIILAHAPTIGEGHVKPVPSLVQLFPNCQYTDTEMIRSLRSVSAFIVFEFKRHSELLLTHSAITRVLNDELSTLDINQPPVSYGVWKDKAYSGQEGLLSRRLYATLVEAIIDLNDPLLLERLYLSYIPAHLADLSGGSHPNAAQITVLLRNGICSEQGCIRSDIPYEQGPSYIKSYIRFNKKTIKILSRITSITYRDLFSPSDIEVFFMQCLLASERKQRGSLKKLMLTDFVGDQKLQVISDKHRRRHHSTTPSLAYNGMIRDVYKTYVNVLMDVQPRLRKEQKGKALPFQLSSYSSGRIGGLENTLTGMLDLLVSPGTEFNSTMNEVLGDTAKPFCWLIQEMLANNRKVSKEVNARNRQKSREKSKGEEVGERENVTAGRNYTAVNLAPNYIAKSAVNMNSVNSVKPKGKDYGKKVFSLSAEQQAALTAEAQGHSLSTKRNIYDDRSSSRESISDMRNFAQQVGDLMVQDARQIEMMQRERNVKIISLNDLKKRLNLTNASDDFKRLLSDGDVEVGLAGEITGPDGHTLFVASDLTAALMLLRISHIDSEIERLLINDQRDRALGAVMDKIFLEYMFKQFPESIKTAGKALKEILEMPFSTLV